MVTKIIRQFLIMVSEGKEHKPRVIKTENQKLDMVSFNCIYDLNPNKFVNSST